MTFIARSRTDSEVSSSTNLSYGPWVADLFQRYQLPPSSHPDASLSGEQPHRVEIHSLGTASLQHGTLVSTAAFYEVTETDAPDPAKSVSTTTTTSSAIMPVDTSPAPTLMDLMEEEEEQQPLPLVNGSFEPHHGVLEAGDSNKRASPVFANMPPPPMIETSLPPKKRRRHKVLRHDVIFCLDPPSLPSQQQQQHEYPLLPDLEYYLFPHDAITEAMNDPPPFEVLFSFHADIEEQRSTCSSRPYATKLEEFAAVCSSAARRRASMDTEDTRSRVVNMRLSRVSRRLFLALKQTVTDFETVCEKMVQLMKFHTQQANGVRAATSCLSPPPPSMLPLPMMVPPPAAPPPAAKDTLPQTEWEEMLCATPRTTFDQRSEEKGVTEDERASQPQQQQQPQPKQHARSASTGSTVKKCLYCGSKSTPMWRRGPQGAGTLCNACGVKWKHGKILAGDVGPTAAGATMSTPAGSNSKERRGSDKKRKKSMGSIRRSGGAKSAPSSSSSSSAAAAAAAAAAVLSARMSDDDMESNIAAAQNLSINDNTSAFAVPWPVREQQHQHHHHQHQHHHHHHQQPPPFHAMYEAQSLSSPMSGSYSPLEESSPGSSPPLSVIVQHRRHTVDMASLSDTPFAGVDAVEAAAVLTLLKRS